MAHGRHYVSLLDGGTKPNLAKLTIARQIASIMLALWRSGETYCCVAIPGTGAVAGRLTWSVG